MELSKNAVTVLERRYLTKDEHGNLVETPEQLFRRVARAVAAADARFGDADTQPAEREFYELMTSKRFLPNSPTLMNAGKPLGQLSACFVLPVGDSMDEIFDAVKNAALIHKSGGGTGFSFSRLRPAGATVRSTGGVASGPISFMKVFNSATEAVKQGGTRRGANMGILRVDHPDILEFIHCKKNNQDITNFNISVGITEAFMRAVERDEDYALIDPKSGKAVGALHAPEVFGLIVDAAWENGEPGIVFLDRLNRDNVLPAMGRIESTNPCGEQPLLPYESCNLGSINLTKMLRETDGKAELDYELLGKTVDEAIHFLDNVIDINHYPLAQIGETTRAGRKVGLGVMGFADLLLLLGIPYDSEEGVRLADTLMGYIDARAHAASRALSKARGAFPAFGESTLKDGAPQRNATVTTIAPTGTLSILAGCSSGIEPVFAYAYIRNVMDNTELVETNPILLDKLDELGLKSDALLKRIASEGTVAHCDALPAALRRVFVCAHDIAPEWHLRMQAAFQRHTDNAVSKTVNFANSATRADVAAVYRMAYTEGLKGVTIYRDGSRDAQVLNIGSVNNGKAAAAQAGPPVCDCEGEAKECAAPASAAYGHIEPRPRPPVTSGFTEKMKIGCGTLYVTVNYDENGICEVFTSTGKAGGCPSQSEATARLTSVALRSGISVEEVYSQLKGIRCPSTIRQPGMSCTSCPDAIAKVLMKVSRFIREPGALSPGTTPPAFSASSPASAKAGSAGQANPAAPGAHTASPGAIHACPECGSPVEHEGGCVICRSCGFSRCG